MTWLQRLALVVLTAGNLVVGLWAQAFPRSFYDDFPGMGRVWVALDGPYNEHLVRDVGGLNLALAFVAAVALVTGSVHVARVAGGAALIYGLPHFLYHATHLSPYRSSDKGALLLSLGLNVVAALLALAAPSGVADQRKSETAPSS
jgi:hypothetical protein